MPPVQAVLLGAGQRGREVVGRFALDHPDELQLVAVADLVAARRDRLAEEHGIPPHRRYDSWQALLAEPRLAAACFNTTMDRDHLDSALAALDAGYDLFLEKPMAHTPAGCLAIAARAAAAGRMVQVCHPLRHTAFYTRIRALLDSGIIGRPLSITMHENVAHWHYAHSYVRGNWRRHDESGPLILTKCCHDMDIATWMAGARVARVASAGSLRHFHRGNAPMGAPDRCTDGCPVESTCPYSAPAFYLVPGNGWPVSTISVDTSMEARLHALRTERYGRCVYRCDNDVVDHQVLSAEFEDGMLLNFSVAANSVDCFRTIRIVGDHGELNGHFERNSIRVSRFAQGGPTAAQHSEHGADPVDGSHGGGDAGVIRQFLRCILAENHEAMRRSLDIAVEGHLLAFAAEEARRTAAMLDMAAYRQSHAPEARP